MKLRSVRELRTYLLQNSLSPEKFAAQCGISNMTVRRWLKNEDSHPLPSKYWPIFDHALSGASEEQLGQSFKFEDGFADLEKHVHHLGEINASSPQKLDQDFQQKKNDRAIGQGLLDKVKMLFSLLTSDQMNHYQRTLVIGAIVYFISPVDLIPDPTPIMGYLDDYAVVTMVLTSVGHGFRKAPAAGGESSQAKG